MITEIKSGKTLSCAFANTFIVCHMRGKLLINEDEDEDYDHDPDKSDDDHDDREGATKRLFFLQLSNFSSLPYTLLFLTHHLSSTMLYHACLKMSLFFSLEK